MIKLFKTKYSFIILTTIFSNATINYGAEAASEICYSQFIDPNNEQPDITLLTTTLANAALASTNATKKESSPLNTLIKSLVKNKPSFEKAQEEDLKDLTPEKKDSIAESITTMTATEILQLTPKLIKEKKRFTNFTIALLNILESNHLSMVDVSEISELTDLWKQSLIHNNLNPPLYLENEAIAVNILTFFYTEMATRLSAKEASQRVFDVIEKSCCGDMDDKNLKILKAFAAFYNKAFNLEDRSINNNEALTIGNNLLIYGRNDVMSCVSGLTQVYNHTFNVENGILAIYYRINKQAKRIQKSITSRNLNDLIKIRTYSQEDNFDFEYIKKFNCDNQPHNLPAILNIHRQAAIYFKAMFEKIFNSLNTNLHSTSSEFQHSFDTLLRVNKFHVKEEKSDIKIENPVIIFLSETLTMPYKLPAATDQPDTESHPVTNDSTLTHQAATENPSNNEIEETDSTAEAQPATESLTSMMHTFICNHPKSCSAAAAAVTTCLVLKYGLTPKQRKALLKYLLNGIGFK